MALVDGTTFEWSIAISVCGDEAVMDSNLLKSPSLHCARDIFVQSGFSTVVRAYNDALSKCETDIVVFAHPDVFLPPPWARQLQQALRWLDRHDPHWAVLGLFGCDARGAGVGFTYSVGLGKFVGTPFPNPLPARAVDEFVFILRRSSGLVFDDALPGPQSQLCATDICLQAHTFGMGVYVIPAFALHNSNGWSVLPFRFWRPYLYVRNKWLRELPIRLPYAHITRFGLPMIKNTIRGWIKYRRCGYRTNSRVSDVVAHYEHLRLSLLESFATVDRIS